MLIVIVIASFYISTYLYENDITLIALSVVLVGILLSVVTVGFIMDGVIDFISQKLEIFYSES
ncbi:type III secretory pathway component EscU [Nosocomiicoccus ampullae]|uniref:Type III secretory pathway component EscU n=1 Tax=Nosocomiicoccus ampullae TaxID=489910 RepID=A0A9Q2CY23_9STAP|nr:type III secretory pathway component EscU [Nosocomiicoccus ampullae]